jgi:hypothetical protein
LPTSAAVDMTFTIIPPFSRIVERKPSQKLIIATRFELITSSISPVVYVPAG